MTKRWTTPKAWALRRCRHQYIYIKRSALGKRGMCRAFPQKRLFYLRAEPMDFYRKTYDDDKPSWQVFAYVAIVPLRPEGAY
jgi:hypothetical protein